MSHVRFTTLLTVIAIGCSATMWGLSPQRIPRARGAIPESRQKIRLEAIPQRKCPHLLLECVWRSRFRNRFCHDARRKCGPGTKSTRRYSLDRFRWAALPLTMFLAAESGDQKLSARRQLDEGVHRFLFALSHSRNESRRNHRTASRMERTLVRRTRRAIWAPGRFLSATAKFKSWKVWQEVDAPVLVLHGTADTIMSPSDSLAISDIVNRAHPVRATYREIPAPTIPRRPRQA